jgi:hypothetical protein
MSSYNYAYGGYSVGQSSRTQSNYYGLTNKCLPRTVAITDNSKFNVGTLVKVYVDVDTDTENNSNYSCNNCNRNCNCRNNCNCNSNCNCKNCNRIRNYKNKGCNLLTNHSDPKDIKAFDKNKDICLKHDETEEADENDENNLEPQSCQSCSLENMM